MMRVDIYDEIVIEVVAGDVAMGIRKYFARIRASCDLLYFVFGRAMNTVD
jgi:hypothetical protein